MTVVALPQAAVAQWAAATGGSFGRPAGFFTDATITETALHEGVVWYEIHGYHGETPQVVHVVVADLARPDLVLRAFPGSRFAAPPAQLFRRSTVSQLLADHDALVAINTAFFDIRGTMAPSGLLMTGGRLLREPHADRPALLIDAEGRVTIGNPTFTGAIRTGDQRLPLAGVNRHHLAGDEIALYRLPWERNPGPNADFAADLALTEVLLRQEAFHPAAAPGEPARLIAEVLQTVPAGATVGLGESHLLLAGAGRGGKALRSLSPGDAVTIEWILENTPEGFPWHDLTEAASGWSLLVVDGAAQDRRTPHWNNRHPRSAVGLDRAATRIVLILVEGRQPDRAAGLSLHDTAAFLLHLGAWQGLEFDGGGSSALAARVDGEDRLLSTPSDRTERYVPAGLGIIVVEAE